MRLDLSNLALSLPGRVTMSCIKLRPAVVVIAADAVLLKVKQARAKLRRQEINRLTTKFWFPMDRARATELVDWQVENDRGNFRIVVIRLTGYQDEIVAHGLRAMAQTAPGTSVWVSRGDFAVIRDFIP